MNIKTAEELYNAPIGAAVYDHHYGTPQWLRDAEGFSLTCVGNAVAMRAGIVPLNVMLNKIVYKVHQNNRYITLAGTYDDQGVIISIML